jgi:hypothetical protein
MMELVMRYFSILIFLFLAQVCFSQQPLVYLKKQRLVYLPYANQGDTRKENVIPDFSFVGYKGGGVSIPEAPVKTTVTAVPGNNLDNIQKAIDEVCRMPLGANGFRGAVLLKAGVYNVEGTLFIKAAGVVLRGEGNGTSGTVMVATQKKRHDFIVVQGDGSGFGEVKDSRKHIVDSYVPVGARSFEVEAGHNFSAGDRIVVQELPNDKWIADLNMAQYGWKADDYKMSYERTITAVKKNKITIDIPIVDAMDSQYGKAEVFKSEIKGRIEQCGIENVRIESVFSSEEDEEHAWNAIVLKRAANCWVKDVVAKYFGYACVSISDMSVFNTVQDCAMIDPKSITTGSRKYSFNIEHNSTCNLYQRCVSWGGRHDYVTGARVPGPNVFLDCLAENTFADIGPHHRWATGLLFDNVYGGQMRVQNRKAMGSGHGWAGAQTLFWNCYSVKEDIKVESPVGALNWGIGNVGATQNGEGYWESWGTEVRPRSLYLKQLEERRGSKAVQQITTPLQRNGRLWEQLKSRASQIVAEDKVVAVDN